VTHHRTPEFRRLFAEVLAGLQYVFQTQNDVVVLASSGSGAMEAAVVNLVPRGGKAIVLEAGVFARRWSDICQAFGIEVVRHEVTWGQAARPQDVATLLDQHPDAVAVFGTLMESSTGVGHDIRAIGQIVALSPALLVVDAVSGAGVMECRTDEWGVDMLVAGSQKGLMLPPGLSFVTASQRAWRQIERIEPQAFYFNLKHYRKKLHAAEPGEGPDTPWTPANTLIVALAETLRLIRATGIEQIWQRAQVLGAATRAGIEALGLEVFASRPAPGLTAVRFPTGLDGAAFLRRLESRFGVKLAGGQDKLKGQIFRIAHLGIIDELDVLGTLAAIELVLDEMGQSVRLGSAVAAASAVINADGGRRMAEK
jgi:aspartate aminotransferase-like enzyme